MELHLISTPMKVTRLSRVLPCASCRLFLYTMRCCQTRGAAPATSATPKRSFHPTRRLLVFDVCSCERGISLTPFCFPPTADKERSVPPIFAATDPSVDRKQGDPQPLHANERTQFESALQPTTFSAGHSASNQPFATIQTSRVGGFRYSYTHARFHSSATSKLSCGKRVCLVSLSCLLRTRITHARFFTTAGSQTPTSESPSASAPVTIAQWVVIRDTFVGARKRFRIRALHTPGCFCCFRGEDFLAFALPVLHLLSAAFQDTS